MSSETPPAAKGKKIKQVFKLAARLPRVLKAGRGNVLPPPGVPPVVILKVQVVGCLNLLAKDRGGTSDPCHLRVSHLSLADRLSVVESIVWDKDMLKKGYLGEVSLSLEDWFVEKGERKEAAYGFDDLANQPISLNLVSTRANTSSTGSVQIKFAFAPTTNSINLMEFDEIYSELVKCSRPSVVSALLVSPIAILIVSLH